MTQQTTDRDPDLQRQIMGGITMIAGLGHSCGLVDPYPSREVGKPAYGPLVGILKRLAETDPWLLETPEYERARGRVNGESEHRCDGCGKWAFVVDQWNEQGTQFRWLCITCRPTG